MGGRLGGEPADLSNPWLRSTAPSNHPPTHPTFIPMPFCTQPQRNQAMQGGPINNAGGGAPAAPQGNPVMNWYKDWYVKGKEK